jgi:hypothetical protein
VGRLWVGCQYSGGGSWGRCEDGCHSTKLNRLALSRGEKRPSTQPGETNVLIGSSVLLGTGCSSTLKLQCVLLEPVGSGRLGAFSRHSWQRQKAAQTLLHQQKLARLNIGSVSLGRSAPLLHTLYSVTLGVVQPSIKLASGCPGSAQPDLGPPRL